MKTHRYKLLVILFVPISMLGLTAVSHAGVKDQIRNLDNKVNDVRNRVNGIKEKTDFIGNNRDSRVRDLFTEIDASRIKELFEMFKQGTNPTEALELIKVLRDDGFLAFRDSPSDQALMRDNLKGILTNMDRIREEIKELRCYNNPDREPIRSNARGGKIEEFIDRFPPVVLYTMKKMLDERTDGKWATMLDDAGVPDELIAGDSLCNDSTFAADFQLLQASNDDCKIRHEWKVCNKLVFTGGTLDRKIRQYRERANFHKLAFGSIAEYLPDETTIGGNITIVGGGGATKSFKIPAAPLLKTVANLMDLLERMLGNVLSRRADCLAADSEMERDLLHCTALAEYETDLCPIQNLAERRANSLNQDTTNLTNASNFIELSIAYQDLRGVESTCGSNSGGGGGGGNSGGN